LSALAIFGSKLGRRTLIDAADLDDLVQRQKRGGPAAE
jgi:hypothetical protein